VTEPTPSPFFLRGEYVTLAHALKAVGLAGSGGEAKHLVRGGAMRVNGQVEVQPGRKLRAGDRFGAESGGEWIVAIEPNLGTADPV
jgi:ribosome-associated protein